MIWYVVIALVAFVCGYFWGFWGGLYYMSKEADEPNYWKKDK